MAQEILRKYNYKLSVGPVGTDDDNMAGVLYGINKMEAPAATVSDDPATMIQTVNDVFTLVTDCKVSLGRFGSAYKNKIDQNVFSAVSDVFSAEQKKLMDAFVALAPAGECVKILAGSYRNILSTVPSLQKMDDQAAGKI